MDDAEVAELIGFGDSWRTVDVPGGGTAVIVDVSAEDCWPAWQAAREALSRTGRWPLITGVQRGDFDGLFSRESIAQFDPDDPSVGAILQRAGELDLDAVLAGKERDSELWRHYLEEDVRLAREATLSRWGRAPSIADLRAAAQAAVDHEVGIEAFLLAWERQQGDPPAEIAQAVANAMGHMERIGPLDPPALVMLPTAIPWEVPAYLETIWMEPPAHVVAAVRRWHENWGAEPVQVWGDIQFHVERPPTDLDSAWGLAREHYLMARDTVVRPDIFIRDYARALLSSRFWCLHRDP
jgi:hypothetical protein